MLNLKNTNQENTIPEDKNLGSLLTNPLILVLTNMPDIASARLLAESLVTQKLSACVNILNPCESIYAWQGKIEHVNEIPMLIKTNQTQYNALEAAIIKAHPYELPEIIIIHVDGGLPQYLQWANTQLSA